MLRLENIHKSYPMGNQSLHVLRGIDFGVESGELVSIMGASGSGKSTLLNILGILDNQDEGSYTLDGRQISMISERAAAELRNRHIGFIFQSFNLLGFKNAAENVALPLYYQGVRRRKRNAIAVKYLEMVGLADRAEHIPSEMSGGERQRIAIARALIAEPSIILADEPTGALDSHTSSEVMHILKNLNDEGKTILIVTHEADIAAQTKRIIYMRDGKIVDDKTDPTHVQP
ncbi:MAG: ABC transporter ATP-binding protein [Gammaproteobacteria bacterium]|nr:ABC transporter ATP-binding protein [Gammaproteobacteria bacterium]